MPGNQIVKHSSDNETVLVSSRKLGGAVKQLIDCREKCIIGQALNFRVRMLLSNWEDLTFLKVTWCCCFSDCIIFANCNVRLFCDINLDTRAGV